MFYFTLTNRSLFYRLFIGVWPWLIWNTKTLEVFPDPSGIDQLIHVDLYRFYIGEVSDSKLYDLINGEYLND